MKTSFDFRYRAVTHGCTPPEAWALSSLMGSRCQQSSFGRRRRVVRCWPLAAGSGYSAWGVGSEKEVTVGVQLRITAHHLPGSGAAEAGRHVPLELFLLPCTTKPKRVDFQSIHTNLTTQNTSSSNQRLPISDWNTREKLLSISMKLPRLFKKDEIASKNI